MGQTMVARSTAASNRKPVRTACGIRGQRQDEPTFIKRTLDSGRRTTDHESMHFALFGDHPDGLDMARALVETGRHQLATYTGPAEGLERLRRWGLTAKPVGDVEEVLADPAIEAVIV